MAEQFGLQQAVTDRCTVHFQILTFPSIRQKVQARGDQLLAGPPLANDEYGFVERGDLGDLFEDAKKCGGFAKESIGFLRHVQVPGN